MDNKYSSEKLLTIIEKMKIGQIDICGIMSSFCVLETIKSLVNDYSLQNKINVLIPFIVENDNNEKLIKFCTEKKC